MGVYTDARYTRIRHIDVKPIYALKGLKYGFADIDYLLILPRIQGTHIDQEQRRALLHLIPEASPATQRFSRAGTKFCLFRGFRENSPKIDPPVFMVATHFDELHV